MKSRVADRDRGFHPHVGRVDSGVRRRARLNTFVLDEYDAYGEVPIPGSTSLHLPAGRDDGQLPHGDHRQRRRADFRSRPRVSVSPARRSSATDGHRKHRRDNVGQQRCASADLDGSDSASRVPTTSRPTDPSTGTSHRRLAFGHDSSHGWVLWLFGGLFAFALFDLFAALIWSARVGKKARPLEPHE